MFENIREDRQLHGSWTNPALWALAAYRFGVWGLHRRTRPARWLAGKFYGAMRLLAEILTGIRLHRETRIGKGIHIVHSGMISIHPSAVIGERVGIMHGVTIGSNMGDAAPVIGNDVFIGVGACILGNVKIGDGARIAANSLVMSDVPAGSIAIGVPARVVRGAAGLGTTPDRFAGHPP